MTRVKVCGITNLKDAQEAIALGAHALGFIFASSPRRVDLKKAQEISAQLPPLVARVGVFVEPSLKEVKEAFLKGPLDFIQLYGQVDLEEWKREGLLPSRIIKALRVKDRESLEEVSLYQGVAAFLLDTYVEDKEGGSGKAFDWSLARQAKGFHKPVILAGGLRPDNISEALETVRPYAVDVNSGVERAPGLKDYQRLKEFIEKVKCYDARC